MIKLFLCFLLGGLLVICSSQETSVPIPAVSAAGRDSLRFFMSIKTGNRLYQADSLYAAKEQYDSALQIEKRIAIADSFLLTPKFKLGSILLRLEEYEKARVVFENLLPNDYLGNDIAYHLGVIALRLNEPAKAIGYFNKVKFINDKRRVDLLYNYTLAFSELKETDSAAIYFDKAVQENSMLNGITKNDSYGRLLNYKGDQLAGSGRYYEAIQQYQHAIIQFASGFTSTNIYDNPAEFSDSVAYADLYHTLIAKAKAFEQLRPGEKNIKALNGALNAYHTASHLAKLVEVTYGSDEARLFTDKIKKFPESGPLTINLELFELTGEKAYFEDAYLLEQGNKSVEPVPSIAFVQQLIDRKTAVLSFYLSGDDLFTIIITRNGIGSNIEPVAQDFFQKLDSFKLSLSRIHQAYDPAIAIKLYNKIISPFYAKLIGMDRLIIIPDKQLKDIPFDALQNRIGQYLLEEFSVQYQYSTALLGTQTKRDKKRAQALLLDSAAAIGNINPDSIRLIILKDLNPADGKLPAISQTITDAGCANMIAPLWTGADTTSAFIINRLLYYLDEGYSRDKALQKARLDLVLDDEIDPQFKTPAHWAQFMYIGQYEPPYTPTPWLLIALVASIVVAIVWVITIKSNY